MKGLLIGGANSGSGKTTLTLGLMAAYKRRGLNVAGFKVGPDFIDPGHHAVASGRPSHNLDGWMLSREENQAIFARGSAGADLALVEGVMGLFDGFHPVLETGSSAQMAKWLGLPVLLAVNARAMARTIAALAKGFASLDPGLYWAGLAANFVGSDSHLDYLRQAMSLAPEMPFAGGLRRREEIALAERHLGLITAEEGGLSRDDLSRLADWAEEGLDLDALLDSLPEVGLEEGAAVPVASAGKRARVGVARDQAFCFYYHENLRRLEAAGAELAFFSPLADPALPAGLDGLYLGGGYPELFAPRLAANASLRQELATAARAGLPIYAECGGMMFLGQEVRDLAGKSWPMCGVLPFRTGMLKKLTALGYRQVTTTRDGILGPAGMVARGHEFHYSRIEDPGDLPTGVDGIYKVEGRRGPEPAVKGYGLDNILASYVHLHFGSNPELAANLVGFCRGERLD